MCIVVMVGQEKLGLPVSRYSSSETVYPRPSTHKRRLFSGFALGMILDASFNRHNSLL